MAKTKIMKRQVNAKNESEEVVCPYRKDGIIARQKAFACSLSCDRYAGRDGEYIICGAKGTNKDMLVVMDAMRKPALWEIFGEGERNWIAGAYGKPLG